MTTASTFNLQFQALSRKPTLKEQWGFRKHWRSAHYHTGDLYQDAIQDQFRQQWRVDQPGPYLQFVRHVSSEWPHLRLLADFMEVGTDPLRWKDFYGVDKNNTYTYPEDADGRGMTLFSITGVVLTLVVCDRFGQAEKGRTDPRITD